jgi:hypothetical protein
MSGLSSNSIEPTMRVGTGKVLGHLSAGIDLFSTVVKEHSILEALEQLHSMNSLCQPFASPTKKD